jgi:hypothetical protein
LPNNWIKEYRWVNLNCLVPVYGQGDDAGNYTEVWLDTGTRFLDRRRVKTVLKSLASYLGVSWQQQYTAWLEKGRSHLAPIVLGPEMALIPLRLRQPRSRDEGGTGYVVGNNVVRCEGVKDGPYRSHLILRGGQVLPCLLSPATVELRLLSGQKALQRRREIQQQLEAAGSTVKEPEALPADASNNPGTPWTPCAQPQGPAPGDSRYYEHPHLLVAPGGRTLPVRVVGGQGNIIILCQEAKKAPG